MLPIKFILLQLMALQLISANRYTDICERPILADNTGRGDASAGSNTDCQK